MRNAFGGTVFDPAIMAPKQPRTRIRDLYGHGTLTTLEEEAVGEILAYSEDLTDSEVATLFPAFVYQYLLNGGSDLLQSRVWNLAAFFLGDSWARLFARDVMDGLTSEQRSVLVTALTWLTENFDENPDLFERILKTFGSISQE